MVAHGSKTGFVPAERPRIAVTPDGTLAAIQEPTRVTIIEVAGCEPFADLALDATAVGCEIAWIGAPPRLLLLTRFAAHSAVQLLDPHGLRTIAEIRLESAMRLYACVGTFALAIGSLGAAVLAISDTRLTRYQFPARALPMAAGGAGGQFVVALAGSIEEWDPASRMPKRRLRLPRPATITAVGGTERAVWLTTQQDPHRIDVIPLVNRGQPKAHDLSEPIAQISGHPRSDLLACIGASSGRVHLVDLDGRQGVRVLGDAPIKRADAVGLVVGHVTGVMIAQAQHPIAIVTLGTTEAEPAKAPRAARPVAPSDPLEDQPRRSTLGDDDGEVIAPPVVRDAVEAPTPAVETYRTWRDALVAWTRSGLVDHVPLGEPIRQLTARLALPEHLVSALVLCYGAHLCGEPGVPPVDIARVLGGRWDEALGSGELALRGVAVYAGSRVSLARPLLRMLDELSPGAGSLVGVPADVTAALRVCVVIAEPDEPLHSVAKRTLGRVGGAILAADPAATTNEVMLEARVRGAMPMIRGVEHPGEPVILVVADGATADLLDLPRL